MIRSEGERIARNTSYLVVSKTLVLAAGFFFSIVLARYLSVERFGVYAFAVSYLTIFAIVVKFGIRTLIIREVSKDKTTALRYLNDAVAAQALIFVLALAAIWATTTWLQYPAFVRMLIFLLSATVLMDALSAVLNAIFSAFERMEYPATVAVIEKLVFIGWGIGVIVSGRGLAAVGVGLLVSKAVGGAAAFGLVHTRLQRWKPGFDLAGMQLLLRNAAPFFVISVLSELYAEIDMTMLFSLQGAAAAGLYSAAFRLGRFPSYLSNAFHQAVYPLLARQAVASPRRLAATAERSIRLLATVAVPIGVVVTVLADRLLAVSFGEAFVAAAPALRVLVWVTALQFVNPFFSRLLFALDRQRDDVKIHGVGVTVTILLNVALIPRYSHVGAAWGSLIATTLLSALYIHFISDVLTRATLATSLGKPAMAGAAMWGTMWMIGNVGGLSTGGIGGSVGGIGLSIGTGGSVYIMALALLRGLPVLEARSLAKTLAARLR